MSEMIGIPIELDRSKLDAARHALRFPEIKLEIEDLVRLALRNHLSGSRLIYIQQDYEDVVQRATSACVLAALDNRTQDEIVVVLDDIFNEEVDRRLRIIEQERAAAE